MHDETSPAPSSIASGNRYNGHELLPLAVTLGEIKAGGSRNTEILLGCQSILLKVQSSIQDLPEAIAESMADRLAPSPSASMPAAKADSGLMAWMKVTAELARALSPYWVTLVLALVNRFWPSALPSIAQALKAAL